MKKIFVFIIFSCLCLFEASGQEADPDFLNKNAIRINPIAFGYSEFEVAFEHYFGDRKSSITLMPAVILKDNGQGEKKEAWKVMAQYRFYLTHLRKDQQKHLFLGFHNYGFYGGLYALTMDYSEDYLRSYNDMNSGEYQMDIFTKEVSGAEGGALVGLEIDVTNRIQLDFYVGGGIRYTDVTDSFDELMVEDQYYYNSYGVFDIEYQGVKPKLGFMLGISF